MGRPTITLADGDASGFTVGMRRFWCIDCDYEWQGGPDDEMPETCPVCKRPPMRGGPVVTGIDRKKGVVTVESGHEYDEECICYRCTAERDRRRELAGRKPKP